MSSQKAIFLISYDGPALTSHEINVKDLAPALLSLAELLEDSNKALNGDKVKISVNLKATGEGSVEIALSVVQSFLDQALSLLNSDEVNGVINATDLLKILGFTGTGGGVIGIIKWLKGRPVKNITKLKNGSFQLEVDGTKEVKVVSNKEITLFGLLTVRKGFDTIIRKTLNKEGINKVKFLKGSQDTVEIEKEESEYFATPEIEEEILGESELTTNLQIVSITFQEGSKWKFSDGNASFFADILDEEFTKRVQQNEAAFAKDDILKVTLKKRQFLSASGGMKTDYTVVKVLHHRSAAVQIKLPFSE